MNRTDYLDADYLYFDCVGIPYHLFKARPEAWEHVKVGDDCVLQRDRDNIAGDRSAVKVMHDYDYRLPIGYVERWWKDSVATLVDRSELLTCGIMKLDESAVAMRIELNDERREILRSMQKDAFVLPESFLPMDMIVGDTAESNGLRLLAKQLLAATDVAKVYRLGLKYVERYGHSLSGDDEHDFRCIRMKLESMLCSDLGEWALPIEDLLHDLKHANRHLTKGDNVYEVFQKQLEDYDREARKEGGVFDRMLCKYFRNKWHTDLREVKRVKNGVKNYLNSIFRNTYFLKNHKHFALNLFYAEPSNEQLRIVLTHVLAHAFLKEVYEEYEAMQGAKEASPRSRCANDVADADEVLRYEVAEASCLMVAEPVEAVEVGESIESKESIEGKEGKESRESREGKESRERRKSRGLACVRKSFVFDAETEVRNVRLQMLRNGLVAMNCIEADTDFDTLMNVFSSGGQDTDARIRWTGSKQHLAYFIRMIIERGFVRLPKGVTIWVLTRNRFVTEDLRDFGDDLHDQKLPGRKSRSTLDIMVNIFDTAISERQLLDMLMRG